MKHKIYLLHFFTIILLLPLQGQDFKTFTSENTTGDNSNITVSTSCFVDGEPYTEHINVSGLPVLNSEFGVDGTRIIFDLEGTTWDFQMSLTSPSGTTILIADTKQGSWSDVLTDKRKNRLTYSCSYYPQHTGTESSLQSIQSYDAFQGEDPNGTWKVEICNSTTSEITIDYLSVFFRTSNSYINEASAKITDATDCSSADGSFEFRIVEGRCALDGSSQYNFNNTGWIATDQVQGVIPELQTIDNLAPGQYIIKTLQVDADGNSIPSSLRSKTINIGAINATSQLTAICSPDFSIALGPDLSNQFELVPPGYSDDCGLTATVSQYGIMRPDGTIDGPYDYDESNIILYPLDQIGTYTVAWVVTSEQGNSANCNYTITTSENGESSFKSVLCNDPSGELVNSCSSGAGSNATIIPIEINGLPTLGGMYGIKQVWIQGLFPGTLNGSATLVDPSGNRYTLFDSDQGSFPQFDGANDFFDVGFTACNESAIPSHNDDAPFQAGVSYTPVDHFAEINFSGNDPNGRWVIEACSNDMNAWQIFCVDLKFDNLCSTLGDYTIDDDGCQNFINISFDQIIHNSTCIDNDGDGLPDYFIAIDGGEKFTWNPNGFLRAPIAPGTHTIELGMLFNHPDGSLIPSCFSPLEISIQPLPDQEAPVISNCPDDMSVTLNANGEAFFDIVFPSATDNCNIASELFEVNYYDGTTDGFGNINFPSTPFIQGETFNTDIIGTGRVEYDFYFTDEALNTSSCKTIVTSIEVIDPCDTDTEAPVINNCQEDFSVMLDANGEANFIIEYPSATDNCNIAQQILDFEFFDGATDLNGSTSFMGQGFAQGGTRDFSIKNVGRVEFTMRFVDEAMNTATCVTTVTSIADIDPCLLETIAPVISNCPGDMTVILNAYGETFFELVNPTATDFCNTTDLYDINYYDGATDFFGDIIYNDVPFIQGASESFNIKGVGRAEIDFYFTDEALNTSTCKTIVTSIEDIDPCDMDTEAPVISDCQEDFAVMLDANGEANFIIEYPSATDNCNIAQQILDFEFFDGATDLNGSTVFTGQGFAPGGTRDFSIRGVGRVEFSMHFVDEAMNTATCITTVTSIGIVDPCDTDTEDPTLGNCPEDQAVLLNVNGQVVFDITNPTSSDNCGIAQEFLGITYIGNTDQNGETLYNTEFESGKTNFYYAFGAGTVEFYFDLTDDSGNSTVCISNVLVLEPEGPCFNDTEAPVLTNCIESISATLEANDQITLDLVAPEYADNCGISNTEVYIQYSGGATDPNGDTERQLSKFKSGGKGSFVIVGAGTVDFNFTVTDPSGNISTCLSRVSTIYSGTDVIFNMGSVCAVPGISSAIPVSVINFDEIGAFEFDLEIVGGSGLSFQGIDNIALSGVTHNILPDGKLKIIWFDPNGDFSDLPDNFRLFDVIINVDNAFVQEASIISEEVIFESNVHTEARVITSNICVGSGVLPSGTILDRLDQAHGGVPINLRTGATLVNSTTSNANGEYAFEITNETYRIRPNKNDEIRKGISIFDVAAIRRHALRKVLIQNNYQLVAADVNKDGRINVLDASATNRVYLKKQAAFPNNTSWRFLPESLDISANPLDVNHSDQIRLNTAGLDYNNLNFISIKVGDVDNSALNRTPNNNTNASLALTINVPDITVNPEGEFAVPVLVSGGDMISALSMNLNYDPNHLQLVSITSDVMQNFSGGNYNDENGDILIGWDHPNADAFTGDGTLMTLHFTSVLESGDSEIDIVDLMVFDDQLETVTADGEGGTVSLMTTAVEDLNLDHTISVSPNPFEDILTINVNISSPQQLSVTFFDLTGRVLKTISTNKKSDHILNISDLNYAGVIIAIIEGESFTETIRVVKI